LEEALISSLAALDIPGERRAGWTGVWARGLKLASIGVAVRGQTSFHGFALNVDPDLSHFAAVSPCGLDPALMGSIARLRPRTSMPEVRASVRSALEERLA
ncbi:MAG: lipoyl(octanoyl) transferase, partial [Elusimicrobiota bacterium]